MLLFYFNSCFISFVRMNQISDAQIDSQGRFKYILIKLSTNGLDKHIVRGYAWAEYHG